MSLLLLFVALGVIGLQAIKGHAYLPMDGRIKPVYLIVIVLCVAIWLLYPNG